MENIKKPLTILMILSLNTVYFVSASTETGAIRPCIWVDISSIQKEGND